MPGRTKDYKEDYLYKMLRKQDEASAYLRAAIEDSQQTGNYGIFLLALMDVAKAHGVQRVATKTGRSRTSLYKALAKDGDPRLSTILDVLKCVDIGLDFQALKKGEVA